MKSPIPSPAWRSFARAFAVLLTLQVFFPSILLSADVYNLEENLPLQVVDAIPTAYMNRELQGIFRYDRTNEGQDAFLLEPRLEAGILPNLQMDVSIPFKFGSGHADEGLGDFNIGALYNFNQETLLVPALALSGRLEFPTGDDSEGVDTVLKFIATKTFAYAYAKQRINLNIAWKHNSDPMDDERENYYELVIGYDRVIFPDMLLVIDFVREEQKQSARESNILEAGIRYQLNPLAVISSGIGTGIGDESPDFRFTIGFQHPF